MTDALFNGFRWANVCAAGYTEVDPELETLAHPFGTFQGMSSRAVMMHSETSSCVTMSSPMLT